MPPDQHEPHPHLAHIDPDGPIFAAKRVWPAYFDKVAGKPARETLTSALDAFEAEGVLPGDGSGWHGSPSCESVSNTHGSESRATGSRTTKGRPTTLPLAIDLGCGEGRDTVELLRRGWRVIAIDGHPDAFHRLRRREDLTKTEHLELRHAPFEGLELPRVQLVNASFSLPFCEPEHFAGLWATILGAIEPGGRFAGQLFGDRDDWATIEGRSHQTRAEAEALLAGLEVESFAEVEDDGKDALENPKHWHRFDVVARQPGRKGDS